MTPTQLALPRSYAAPTPTSAEACALPMTVDVVPEFRYRLKSMEDSSVVYGRCEVCGKACSEVFLQVEEQRYSNAWTFGWTRQDDSSLFGHKACLLGRRRRPDPQRWPTSESVRIASATADEAVQGMLEAAREAARLDGLSAIETYWQGGHPHTEEAHEGWHRLLYAKSEAEARIGLFFEVLPLERRQHTTQQAINLYPDVRALLSQAQREALDAPEAPARTSRRSASQPTKCVIEAN